MDIKTITQKICDSDLKTGVYVTEYKPLSAITKKVILDSIKEITGLKLTAFKHNKDSVVIDFNCRGESFVLTLV
jgi:hypothetical protein